MAQVINTNSLSLVAQNNLNKSQSALGTSIQRLSSGMRINSAKDDAAGQAISNRFTANITGLTQASRNANDGISIAQTTEGALNEVNDNLQNIRRLTVQAQNGTNSESDRKSIQDEIDARLAEINRISEQTEFNGVKVLSKDQTLSIQVGSNDGQTIDINLSETSSETLGMGGFDISTITSKFSAEAGATVTDANGVTATLDASAAADMKAEAFDSGASESGEIYQHTDAEGKTSYFAVGTNSSGETIVKTLDVSIDGSTGEVTFTKADVTDADEIASYQQKATNTGNTPLATIDAAMAKVDEMRSGLGATQNRFASVISNLNSTVNNLSESRSRILDADFASEVSEMSRANILQSAGISVLAQANQVPQNVLSLLR
jgi:flagellin